LKHVLVSGLALGGFRAGCPKPHRLVDEEGRLCCRNRLTVRSRCPAAASQRRGAMSRAARGPGAWAAWSSRPVAGVYPLRWPRPAALLRQPAAPWPPTVPYPSTSEIWPGAEPHSGTALL